MLLYLMLWVVAAITFVACDDYDNGYSEKNLKFRNEFVKTFGSFDAEQDWNRSWPL